MNYLVSRYNLVDHLLDSSIARDLIEDYDRFWASNQQSRLQTITEEVPILNGGAAAGISSSDDRARRFLNERTPLLLSPDQESEILDFSQSSREQDTRRIVLTAVYVNLIANLLLLIAKIVVTLMTSSVSVLASLVDAALDFLSTAIIWSTTRLTVRRDRFRYPVGRQRLEPLGVLIFAVVMITSFFQVATISLQRLFGEDHNLIALTVPALIIMASTVTIKGLIWIWCRRINNSNVQALAQDAMTDVIFNIFSIIFPLGQFLFLCASFIKKKDLSPRMNYIYEQNLADAINSRHIYQHLVPRSPRRSHSFNIRDRQLGNHCEPAHCTPYWSRGIAC
jgi:Cation efflux family